MRKMKRYVSNSFKCLHNKKIITRIAVPNTYSRYLPIQIYSWLFHQVSALLCIVNLVHTANHVLNDNMHLYDYYSSAVITFHGFTITHIIYSLGQK